MRIPRHYDDLSKYLEKNKVIIIFGPRRVGKTNLLNHFLNNLNLKYRLFIGDDIRTQEIFESQNLKILKEVVEGYDLIAIDEAQRIKNIGLTLKLLVDNLQNIFVIATGSSSFELLGQTGEPLTGRKRTLTLFPISQMELSKIYNKFELKEKIQDFLIFGSYPEVLIEENRNRKIEILMEITGSYLLKDILEFEKVKGSKVIFNLLRLLAYQIGSEVSYSELAQNLKVDPKTVARYLDLLEKSYVIYQVQGFSRNLRKEITKKSKYYFYDNGIRNAIISNFSSIFDRNDIGSLWENFLFTERLKKRAYCEIYANMYFWRSWQKNEIDLIEEREGKLFAYEFKWKKERVKIPRQWAEAYPGSKFEVITYENYLDFIL